MNVYSTKVLKIDYSLHVLFRFWNMELLASDELVLAQAYSTKK